MTTTAIKFTHILSLHWGHAKVGFNTAGQEIVMRLGGPVGTGGQWVQIQTETALASGCRRAWFAADEDFNVIRPVAPVTQAQGRTLTDWFTRGLSDGQPV